MQGGYGQGGYGQPAAGQGWGGGYGGAPQGPAPGYSPLAQYEFGPHENAVIDRVGSRATFWGIVLIIIGTLLCLATIQVVTGNFSGILNLPMGIVVIVVGVKFLGAGKSFKDVVHTQGNDISNLLRALDNLGSALLIQIIMTIVVVVLTIIMIVLLVLFAAAMFGALHA